MKKAIVVFFLIFFGFQIDSFAQIPNEHSSIRRGRGKRYVKNYQRVMGHHPSSFVIRAKGDNSDGVADYLLGTLPTMENTYLHIYFGVKKLMPGDVKEDTALVIVGAKQVRDAGGNLMLEHDTRSGMWATPHFEPNCCVPFDSEFDYADHNETQGCKLSDCTAGAIDDRMAKEYIHNFQLNDGNIPGPTPVIYATESFIVSANDIREYLRAYPEVEYLQFYIGEKTTLGTYDNLTLMIVGLDKNGKHIWDGNTDGYAYLFDETMPCPRCNIVNDSRMDDHHQDGTDDSKKR